MSTTSLFVEILIIGIIASIWIVLPIYAAVGPLSPVTVIDSLKSLQALLAAAYLSSCYALGIIVDRSADLFFSSTRIAERILKEGRPLKKLCDSVSKHGNEAVRFQVAVREGCATESLDYLRSRLRISRATTVNAVLLLLVTTLPSILKIELIAILGPSVDRALVFIIGVGMVLILGSFLATVMLENSYMLARERIAIEMAKEGETSPANVTPEHADPPIANERDRVGASPDSGKTREGAAEQS